MSSDSPTESGGGGSLDKNKKLRRPYASTFERLKNGELETNPETMVKSTLSADAKEFVPMSFQLPAQQQQTEYTQFQKLASNRPAHLTVVPTTSESPSAVNMFKDAVFRLTSNPGSFKENLTPVVDVLNNNVTEKEIVDEIIETLFEQSIREPNFRFTGAKICKHLSETLKTHHPTDGSFRGRFLNRCSVEFSKRQEMLTSNKERLCCLAMFFGELFLVIEIPNNGVLTKIGKLRVAISEILQTLLANPDDVTVKCATKLLKLTGTALMETKDLDGNFDDIFAKIKSLEKSPALDKTSHCLINSVLSRLQYNFGVEMQPSPERPQAQSQSHSQSQERFTDKYALNEPIFYNAAQQPCTREQAGYCQGEGDIEGLSSEEQEFFLQCEAENYANQQQQWMEQGSNGYINQQSWLDQGGDNMFQQQYQSVGEYTQWSSNYDGPEFSQEGIDMDEEMYNAYELFLRESGQGSQR